MKDVIYFSRNKKAGFSIQKVFKIIINSNINISHNIYEVPCFRADFKSILTNLKFVYSKRNKNKIHHITGDIHYCILALLDVKTVLTVHDLVLLKNTNNFIKKRIYFLLWYYLPIKLATRVTCISEETKKDILRYVKRNDIAVITNPVSDDFKENRKLFNNSLPVILHIGTGWNKNLTNVIKSLHNINSHLRIVGKIKNTDLELLKTLKVNYSNVFNISDNEIIEEYNNADIISFPSIFEGFGMPIIEGQSVGRVVLTSNVSPMKEIGNISVHQVDPKSVENIREGFLRLIKDDVYRSYLIKQGFFNVKKHNSSNVSKNYKSLYEQIIF